MIRSLKLIVLGGAFISCLPVLPLHAEESGQGHYTPGEEGSFTGVLPQPGKTKFDLKFYSNEAHVDQSRSLSIGQYVGASVDRYTSISYFNFSHVIEREIVGANLGFEVKFPLVYQESNASVYRKGTLSSTQAFKYSNNFGLGDMVLTPLMLGWHKQASHIKTGVNVYAPTGEYDKSSIANTGLNYWTFSPFFAYTYVVPGKNEISANTGIDFNTKNTDTNYQTGTQWHLDYLAAHYFNPWISLGVAGTVYQQIEADSGEGAVLGKEKSQSYGLGPVFRYNGRSYDSDNIFEIKWIPEFDTKNRPEGNPVWFNWSWTF